MSETRMNTWFHANFGTRPAEVGTERLRDRIKSQELALEADRRLLRALEDWERTRMAVLIVWNLTDAQKRDSDAR